MNSWIFMKLKTSPQTVFFHLWKRKGRGQTIPVLSPHFGQRFNIDPIDRYKHLQPVNRCVICRVSKHWSNSKMWVYKVAFQSSVCKWAVVFQGSTGITGSCGGRGRSEPSCKFSGSPSPLPYTVQHMVWTRWIRVVIGSSRDLLRKDNVVQDNVLLRSYLCSWSN